MPQADGVRCVEFPAPSGLGFGKITRPDVLVWRRLLDRGAYAYTSV